MLLSMMTPLLSTVLAQGTEPSSTYVTSFGVLSSDNYVLYPFAAQNLNIGFSKYGELIGINATADQTVQSNWIGLNYNGRDPFCPASVVPMTSWVNGWFMFINYIDPTLSTLGKADRCLFAFAMFSDGTVFDNDWQYSATGPTTGVGGRQTNGTVVTDPLKVLYDGPREFIAQSVNHIYDKQGSITWPVVDLTITVVFDKVMKQVVMYKDTKITIPKVHIYGNINVQLSNREEFDLGPYPTYDSYVHYYREAGYTSYTGNIPGPTGLTNWQTGDWHDAVNLTADYWESQTPTAGQTTFILNPPGGYMSPNFLKVYIGGVFVDPTTTPSQYTINWGTHTVKFATPPWPGGGTPPIVKFFYKFVFAASQPFPNGAWPVSQPLTTGSSDWNHLYDYAQVISSDGAFIAWDGLWPPVSSWTVDGILDFLRPLYQTYISDMNYEPKQSPLILGQWDFQLDHTTMPIYRCVEVKGISNHHDGDDANAAGQTLWSGGNNKLDTEARFQLMSVFQPFDLNQAVESKLNTWVTYYTISQADYTAYQTNGYFYLWLPHTPIHYASWWEGYNVDAERVFVNGVMQYPDRQLPTLGMPWQYILQTWNGAGAVVFLNTQYQPSYNKLSSVTLLPGTVLKFIYSTDVTYTVSTFTLSGTTQTFSGTATQNIGWNINNGTWTDYLGVKHNVWADNTLDTSGSTSLLTWTPPTTWPTTNSSTLVNGVETYEWTQTPFKLFKEDSVSLEMGSEFPAVPIGYSGPWGSITCKGIELNWNMYYKPYDLTMFNEWLDVHIYGFDIDVTYGFVVSTTVFTGSTPGTNTVTITPLVGLYSESGSNTTGPLFLEKIPGRYEYGVVGTTAASVDSAGLSMITAAFKDKQVEYGIAAEDMFDTTLANQIPFVMSRNGMSTTVTKNDYYYKAVPAVPADYRVGLMDDFCTTWQITSANLIGSGGPLANLLAWYDNDFESAFYALPQFTTFATWSGKIAPLPCWNGTKKGYADTASTGYAVISIVEDINGTNIFMVWGNWGRDTYNAAQWFWQDGIQEFQYSDFIGATSVVLQINYNSAGKATSIAVPEILGTISETTTWNPYSDYLNGIPPGNPYVVPALATMTYAKKGGLHDP